MSHHDSKHPRTDETLHHPIDRDAADKHSAGESAHHERPSHTPHHERADAHSHQAPGHPRHHS
jgi:hypothetical protein